MLNNTSNTPAKANLDTIRQLAAQGEAISHALAIAAESQDHELPPQHVAEIQRLLHSLFKKINEQVEP